MLQLAGSTFCAKQPTNNNKRNKRIITELLLAALALQVVIGRGYKKEAIHHRTHTHTMPKSM
jgi:hypothetical protein